MASNKRKRLVDYSDSESEDDYENVSPPRKKNKSEHSSENPDVNSYFNIQRIQERTSRKFRTTSSVYEVNVNNYAEDSPFHFVESLFDGLVQTLKEECSAEQKDKMRVSIDHPSLKMGIFIPFQDVKDLKGETLLFEIEKVTQSNTEFNMHDGQMKIEVTHTKIPKGTGQRRKKLSSGIFNDVTTLKKTKHSVVQINNTDDSMCLARAIVVGKCKSQQDDSEEWKKRWDLIKRSNRPMQKIEAEQLLSSVQILPDQPCGIEEYKKIQDKLYPEYVIKIHEQNVKSGLLFPCPKIIRDSKVIHIYYTENHYDCITNIKGFLGCSYYCEYCDIGYQNREGHPYCPYGCVCCAPEKCRFEKYITCNDCHRDFLSQNCFNRHKAIASNQTKSICQLIYKCKKCGMTIIETKKNHVCKGMKKCKYCKKMVGPDHKCFIPKYESKQDKKMSNKVNMTSEKQQIKAMFIFYDFECQQDSGTHVPNFCVAHRVCEECICQPIDYPCTQCDSLQGGKETIFRGKNTLAHFCTWLFNPMHKGFTCIAHNFKAYDGQFILRHLTETGTVAPDVVMNGNNILLLKMNDLRLIDSYNYIQSPLSKFPSTFQLQEMAKGFFPHWANTDTFQNYVGPYLNLDFYKPNGMSVALREEFYQWYNDKKQNGNVFNFQYEMEKYCRSDVDILRRGCGKFRELFLEHGSVDPFTEATTIAQACNLVWRKKFMPQQTIGLIPAQGYVNQRKFSIKGIRWLQSIAVSKNIHIQHALNGGEYQIGSFSVDGFDRSSNTVFEFFGCLYHGCQSCYKNRQYKNPFSLKTMADLYNETQNRLAAIQSLKYTVVTEWEHDYDKRYKQDPEFKTKVDQFCPNQDPLKPRDALFGGRTNAMKLLHEIDERTDEEIKYIDVCSLYPFVCKYKTFPTGHPDILTQEHIDTNNLRQYEGLIKCKVLPPKHLYHPVLPYHCNGKMLFPLCRTCAEDCLSSCNHTDEERGLVGTWVSVELFQAMNDGYEIMEVYEVWHFQSTLTYDKTNRTSGLFSDYINTYLKLKQEASGYPEGCETEEAKAKFRQDYLEAENIVLEQVEKNGGLRGYSKIMLNCLWGKLAQRDTLPKTKYISDSGEYFDLITDHTKTVKHVEVYPDRPFILVNYEDHINDIESHLSSNVVVASYVTAYARLELYRVLQNLGPRALYCDTDSVIYIHQPDQWNPDIGTKLGEWTDEEPKSKIIKFIGLGPKNYGYQYREKQTGNVKTKCKVKGITLDYNTSKLVNFDVMYDCVTSQERNTVSVVVEYPCRIRRHRDRTVTSEKQTKTFRFVYTKRIIKERYETIPYGYRDKTGQTKNKLKRRKSNNKHVIYYSNDN